MSKHTGKGRPGKGSQKKKEAAFNRHAAGHAMPQHPFVGDAEPERAEAEFRKADRMAREGENSVVREMAEQLDEEANRLSPPASFREGVEMLKELRTPEAREELREKARRRLDRMPDEIRARVKQMPQPVQFAVELAERAANLAMKPIQRGVKLVSEVLRVPGALYRILTHHEA